MYQATVFAVILFVNGVQIPMSAPAVVEGETAWIPVRAVFTELGWQVSWDGANQTISITGQDQSDILVQMGNPQADIGKDSVELAAAPRRREGIAYIPVHLLTVAAGAQLHWDNQQKTLQIEAMPVGDSPPVVEIGQLVANPPRWMNKLVTVRGEYTGWSPNPFSPATSKGPPATRSDWTLRDGTGSIYCSASDIAPERCPIALRPYEDRGRRIEVTGAVRLANAGFPYLAPTEITPISGLKGLTCYLTTDQRRYQPGEIMVMKMAVENPFPEAVTLQFASDKTYDFIVCDEQGNKVWQWSDDKVFTMALTSRKLQPGEGYQVSAKWMPATGADGPGPDRYRIEGIINADVTAYPHTIEITKPE